jgi:hypothetical protein
MKLFCKAIILLSTAMMFAFCAESPKEEQPLTVAEISISGISSTINADATGGEYPFTVTANTAWTISKENLDWAQLSVTEGAADKQVSVTLTVPEYAEEPTREGTFTITAADDAKTSKTFTVSQTGVEPTAYDKHATGYAFFEDNFNWITALWPEKFNVSKYGWVSVKVDETNWNEYGISTDAPTAEAFDTRGYVYDGPNTYCRYEGYVKFGRTAQVGSLVTPALSGIDEGTVATLSVKWDASLYVTGDGVPDTFQQISITVSGNGTIASCGTDGATMEADNKKAIIPILGDETHRFKWTRKEVIVVDADKDTRIMFGASEEIKARCFVDNISITRAAENATAGEDVIQPLPTLDKEISMTTTSPVSADAGNVNFSVRINREWSITSDKEWLTISRVASGSTTNGVVIAEDKLSATVPATCLPFNNTVLRAEANPETSSRSATVTISADGTVQQTFTVEQAAGTGEPEPEEPIILAQWVFSGVTSSSPKGTSWIAGGTAASDDTTGSTLTYIKDTKNLSTPTFSVGTTTQNKNRLRSHDLYLDDCLEFNVPVTNLAAGSSVSFINAYISCTQYGPKYWMEEYSLDNGVTWSAAVQTITEPSATNAARTVTYTHMLPSQDIKLSLDCVINIPNAITSGNVKLRMRVADVAQSKTSNGDMITPNASKGIAYILSDDDLGSSSSTVSDNEAVIFKFIYTPPAQ